MALDSTPNGGVRWSSFCTPIRTGRLDGRGQPARRRDRVVAVDDGESALREIGQAMPNLIVLDVRLPGIDGWEVCRRVREESNVPILILTALTEDESLVRGLRLGADDYLGNPFSPVVLAARVQALLRRAGNATLQQHVLLRGLSIDLSSAEVRRDDQPVHLTPTEFRLLASLARRWTDRRSAASAGSATTRAVGARHRASASQ